MDYDPYAQGHIPCHNGRGYYSTARGQNSQVADVNAPSTSSTVSSTGIQFAINPYESYMQLDGSSLPRNQVITNIMSSQHLEWQIAQNNLMNM